MALLVLAAAVAGYLVGRTGSDASLKAEVAELRHRQDELERVVERSQTVRRSVTVPNVIGLELEQAEAILRDAGLRPAVLRGDRSAVATRVVAQEPGPGLLVPSGATVGLLTAPRQFPG